MERTADFRGPVTYVASLEDGAALAPRTMNLTHTDDFLLGDVDGELQFIVSVEGRWDLDGVVDGCPVFAEAPSPTPSLRSHMRADWSRELSGAAARELLGEAVDASAHEEPSPARPATRYEEGSLVRHAFWSPVFVQNPPEILWILHELRFEQP